ncbi:MAG: hypothetical protein ACRDNS_18285, partial [Trebonia sp.]
RAAMLAHETQITVDGDYFALSNEIGRRIIAREYYSQRAGPRAARHREAGTQHGQPDGYERDLFAR